VLVLEGKPSRHLRLPQPAVQSIQNQLVHNRRIVLLSHVTVGKTPENLQKAGKSGMKIAGNAQPRCCTARF